MDSESEAGSGLAESITGDLVLPPRALFPAPLGGDPASVRLWFDAAAIAHEPVPDGTLAGERDAADAYARMAKVSNSIEH